MIEFLVRQLPAYLPLRLLRIPVAGEEEGCQNLVEVAEAYPIQEAAVRGFLYPPERVIHRLIGGYYSSRNHHRLHCLL